MAGKHFHSGNIRGRPTLEWRETHMGEAQVDAGGKAELEKAPQPPQTKPLTMRSPDFHLLPLLGFPPKPKLSTTGYSVAFGQL